MPSVSARLSDLNKPRVEGRGDPNSLAWRVSYWGRLLPMTAENPITGIGLDQVLERTPEKLMPHNSFVQALVETGVLGLTCLLGLIFSTGRALRDAIRGAPPGLGRGVAIGAAAAGLGWVSQLISENLLTQAAIYWYLVAPVAWALADRAAARRRRGGRRACRHRCPRRLRAEELTMRILHVDKFLRRSGGAAGYMLDLAERQRAAGHDVEFFAMAHPDNLAATYDAHFPPFVSLEPPPLG